MPSKSSQPTHELGASAGQPLASGGPVVAPSSLLESAGPLEVVGETVASSLELVSPGFVVPDIDDVLALAPVESVADPLDVDASVPAPPSDSLALWHPHARTTSARPI